MANILYTNALREALNRLLVSATGSVIVRAMLERSTSGYTPDIDHDFLDAFTGGSGVELSVTGYSRQTLGSKSTANDDTADRAEFTHGVITFASLASGQTAKAMLLYLQVGGDDTTPEDDILLAYLDTMGGVLDFPIATNGGDFTFTVDLEGLIQAAQA